MQREADMSQNLRLGIFIIVTLAILATAVFLIGSRESLFRSKYQVRADFDNVAGLDEGADVRVGGIRKGSVKKIQLPKRPDGKVVVLMDLAKETQSIVKADSLATIKSEGMLGDKYVEISFGSVDAAMLHSGETIGSQPPIDISDLFAKTNKILDSTQTSLDHIQSATSNMNDISMKINHGQGTMGALINDKTIYNKAAASVSALDEDMEALKHNFLLRGFFNKRGYVDSDELKKHEIAKLPAAQPEKSFSYDPKQIFDKPTTAKLKNQKTLNEVGQYLQSKKFGEVVIAASAGMKGDSEKDRVTTEAQAMVIRNYLVQNFRLDDTHIKTMGRGKTEDTGDTGKLEILVYPADVTAAVQK
jgi:phospholipid/cholesterol/gamma-HCH transport system substrate-binding protein